MQAVLHCKAVCAWRLRNRRCSTRRIRRDPKDPLRESGVPAAEPLMIKVSGRIVYLSRYPLGLARHRCFFVREKPQTSSDLKRFSDFGFFFRTSSESADDEAHNASPPSRLDAQLFIHTAGESGDLLLNLLRNSGRILPVDFSRFRENTLQRRHLTWDAKMNFDK